MSIKDTPEPAIVSLAVFPMLWQSLFMGAQITAHGTKMKRKYRKINAKKKTDIEIRRTLRECPRRHTVRWILAVYTVEQFLSNIGSCQGGSERQSYGSDGWRHWWQWGWWTDMRKMRWIRGRRIALRLEKWITQLIPSQTAWCISKWAIMQSAQEAWSLSREEWALCEIHDTCS